MSKVVDVLNRLRASFNESVPAVLDPNDAALMLEYVSNLERLLVEAKSVNDSLADANSRLVLGTREGDTIQ